MRSKIAIIGYSGHAYVVLDAALEAGLPIDFYCEKNQVATNPFQLEYLGFEGTEDFKGWVDNYTFILGIGENKLRQKLGQMVLQHHCHLVKVISPAASVSKYSNLGIGVFISRNVSVNALAEVGDFCILNTGCIVEHECKIANGVHIAPGAVVAGNVTIGANTFVGANAVIKQGLTIGANVVIGAGSVIVKDVANDCKIVGNPGRNI